MGGGGKGGSADSSGMYAAMASAQAADKAYQLGEQQFQWSKQVWDQMQPLVSESEQAQIDLSKQQAASLQQMQAETQAQWDAYQQTYAPLEAKFAQEAQNWASPQAMAQARGEAMASVGAQGMAGVNTAAETLRSYGVNPGSARYAGLYTSAQPMIGAAEAAAGTTAAQNLRAQQMQLESGAINTGRGMVNTTGSLTQAGTGAGSAGATAASGAGSTAFGNLTGTGVGAGATSNLFNAGANNMNSYVSAVNGYNQSQAEFAQAGASEMGGFGSALGTIFGGGLMPGGFLRSDERDKTDIHREGSTPEGIPLYSYRYKEDPKSYPKVVGPMAQDIARMAPDLVGAIPGSPKGTLAIKFQEGGDVPYDPRLQPGPAANTNRANFAARQAYLNSPQAQEIMGRASAARQGGAPVPTASQLMQAKYGAVTPVDRVGMATQPYETRRIAPSPVNINEGGGNPMSPIARPQAVGLQSIGPHTLSMPMPANTMAERYGGPIRRFQEGGDVMGSDPQLTPNQGGGATGIPSQPLPPAQMPPGDATPGGGVPAYSSPSNGVATDDVPAMLTANEFVIPKDVAVWKGHEYFAKQIDMARRAQQQFSQRDDIGGEPTQAIPQQPTFVSRPTHMGTTQGAIPGMG